MLAARRASLSSERSNYSDRAWDAARLTQTAWVGSTDGISARAFEKADYGGTFVSMRLRGIRESAEPSGDLVVHVMVQVQAVATQAENTARAGDSSDSPYA